LDASFPVPEEVVLPQETVGEVDDRLVAPILPSGGDVLNESWSGRCLHGLNGEGAVAPLVVDARGVVPGGRRWSRVKLTVGNGVDVELHHQGSETCRSCDNIQGVVRQVIDWNITIVDGLVGHAVDDELSPFRQEGVDQQELECRIEWYEPIGEARIAGRY